MPYLFHAYKEDVRLLDSEGRTYVIPPNKPWKVPSLEGTDISGPIGMPAYRSFTVSEDKMAKQFLIDGKHYGLVSIDERITDQGITFDINTAAERSKKARYDDQTLLLDQYIRSAHEGELNKQPVPPPVETIQRILDERGLDLQKDFGVTPVGYKVSEYAMQRDQTMKQLAEENAAQKKEMAEMRTMLQRTLEALEGTTKKKKGAADESF